MRVAIDREGIERFRQSRVRLPQPRVQSPRKQSLSLHQRAANRLFEILHFIAVGRPVNRMRPGHPRQRLRIPQPLRVLPRPAIRLAIGMTTRTGDPPPPHHGLKRRVKQPLPLQHLCGIRCLADIDRRQFPHARGLKHGHLKIERIEHIELAAIRRKPNRSRVVPQSCNLPDLQFLVIIIQDIQDEHVVRPGKHRDTRRHIRR